MKKLIKNNIHSLKKGLKEIKNKMKKTLATKLFWCESLIIVAIFMFVVTNFLVNFYLGMYLLSLSLFGIALFAWKYL
ncbi:hypothetical protein [Clostridium baratii]|uniref:hypothetical protein n=1 Tax=Clostridium baratii TaxID=1561 RepID=UPI003D3366C2